MRGSTIGKIGLPREYRYYKGKCEFKPNVLAMCPPALTIAVLAVLPVIGDRWPSDTGRLRSALYQDVGR